MASATICPEAEVTEPPKPIVLQDAVATDYEDTDSDADDSELSETEEQSIEEAWEEAVRELVNAIKDPVNKYID